MNKLTIAFLFGIFSVCSGHADSFLTAQKFPKTFEDLSFASRIEVLREGYMPFEVEYDENGVCISGCAYRGITIKEDMVAVDEATEEMAELIEQENANPSVPSVPNGPVNMASDWCRNGKSTRLPLRYPVDMSNLKYPITSDFGFRKIKKGSNFHPALDIAVPVGTAVYATADGVVDRVYYDNNGGGNVIDIKHDNGIITQYLHLSKALVSAGQSINACQQIALSGNSGTSTGPHLDYRVRFQSDRNKYIDILCSCKATNRNTHQSYDVNLDAASCGHSLFYNQYKFRYQSDKSSSWRVNNGHCMTHNTDLLPDEVK